MFDNVRVLHTRQLCTPDEESIDTNAYLVPLSRGFCELVTVDANGNTNTKEILGVSKSGPRDGDGYRRAREMRYGPAVLSIIEDDGLPKGK